VKANIALLPGDGIGPEVTEAAVRVLKAIASYWEHEFDFSEHPIGGCAIELTGSPLPEETLAACKSADAVFLGAVGGPKWDNPQAQVRPESGLLALRKELGVFANLRPVSVNPALVEASPLKPEKLQGVDLLVVRELTGGLYFGQPKGRWHFDGERKAVDTLEYSEGEIHRVVDLAFQLANGRRKKVSSVDKANVLETSRLWRQVVDEVGEHYTDVALEHVLVDTAAMRLVSSPASFDVIVTENMFGDILTDEAAVLAGSLGLLPSASLSEVGPGLFEPIHGSAPDIAGEQLANPSGAILSAALLLRYSLKLEQEAYRIEEAVEQAHADGCLTADLGGSLKTFQFTDEVIERMK
jgi:3-isopropylmalate dehydrogenase